MRSVPLPFLSKITLLWTRAREPGPVSPVKVDSPLPFPWTQRGEIYTFINHQKTYSVGTWGENKNVIEIFWLSYKMSYEDDYNIVNALDNEVRQYARNTTHQD